jgi:transposase InsO family protein
MKAASLRGASRRRWVITIAPDWNARPAPDLVERNFTAPAPDCLWVADITYIPAWAGFLYLAVVLDVFRRRYGGWAMATHLRTKLALEALNTGARPAPFVAGAEGQHGKPEPPQPKLALSEMLIEPPFRCV